MTTRELAPPGRCASLSDEPTRVRLLVRAAAPGPLVLSDTHYPGWRATVDGTPAPIHRANLLFRAVCVPAGEHVVEFTFRPWGFGLGLALTGVSLAFATVVVVRRPRRPL